MAFSNAHGVRYSWLASRYVFYRTYYAPSRTQTPILWAERTAVSVVNAEFQADFLPLPALPTVF